MSVNELQKLVDPDKTFAVTVPQPRAASCRQTAVDVEPHAADAADVSLLMAFSINPLVRAINFPLMLWNAYPIALRAWRIWRREGRLNVDFLDTLAIAASLMHGNPMAGAIIIWLIKLGDWIRDLTAAGQRKAMSELLEFQAKTAWVMRDGVVDFDSGGELAIGDEVVVYPGDMIPVDGEIIDGHAMIDQKTITGEGLPVTRGKGEAGVRRDRHPRRPDDASAPSGSAQRPPPGRSPIWSKSAPIGDTRMQNHAEKLADRLVLPTLGTGGRHRRGHRRISIASCRW